MSLLELAGLSHIQLYHRLPPLEDESSQIRLLSLAKVENSGHVGPSGYAEDIICLEIDVFDRSAAPEYRAISYTWGHQNDTTFIWCNGFRFVVRRNRATALQSSLALYPEGYLWIAAICIDQSNNLEKSKQVTMMATTFSAAETVLVYVGEHYDDSEWLLQQLSWRLKANAQYSPYLDWLTRSEQLPQHRLTNALNSFCRRDFWARLWVVQEIRVARQRELLRGTTKLSWVRLEAFMHSDQGQKYTATPLYSMIRSYWIQYSIINAILAFERLQCSDPRDRIFAVLSFALSADTCDLSLSTLELVDYEQSTSQLCTKIFESLGEVNQDCHRAIPTVLYEQIHAIARMFHFKSPQYHAYTELNLTEHDQMMKTLTRRGRRVQDLLQQHGVWRIPDVALQPLSVTGFTASVCRAVVARWYTYHRESGSDLPSSIVTSQQAEPFDPGEHGVLSNGQEPVAVVPLHTTYDDRLLLTGLATDRIWHLIVLREIRDDVYMIVGQGVALAAFVVDHTLAERFYVMMKHEDVVAAVLTCDWAAVDDLAQAASEIGSGTPFLSSYAIKLDGHTPLLPPHDTAQTL